MSGELLYFNPMKHRQSTTSLAKPYRLQSHVLNTLSIILYTLSIIIHTSYISLHTLSIIPLTHYPSFLTHTIQHSPHIIHHSLHITHVLYSFIFSQFSFKDVVVFSLFLFSCRFQRREFLVMLSTGLLNVSYSVAHTFHTS